MKPIAQLCSLFFLLTVPASAEPPKSEAPLLAELFTSQGCSSCPAAELYFAQLADDPGLVTIEWHVDYWDSLVHGGSRWKDPFSSPAFTERQHAYNRALRGGPQVYTPQAVLMGETEFVGSRGADMARARKAATRPQAVLIVKAKNVTVSGTGEGEIVFVRLLDRHETKISGGENNGRKLKSRHVALERKTLGTFSGRAVTIDIPALKAGETCAVFVQEPNLGRVLGASYCS